MQYCTRWLNRVSAPEIVARKIAVVEFQPTSVTLRASNFFVYPTFSNISCHSVTRISEFSLVATHQVMRVMLYEMCCCNRVATSSKTCCVQCCTVSPGLQYCIYFRCFPSFPRTIIHFTLLLGHSAYLFNATSFNYWLT